jgi:DNA recombination protein RmuC
MIEGIIGLVAGLILGGVIVALVMRASALTAGTGLADRDERLSALDTELRQERDLRIDLQSRLAAVDSAREEERRSAEEKLKLIQDAQKELVVQFEALSNKALKSNNEQFLQVARGHVEKIFLEADKSQEKRSVEMQKLVEPLKDSLKTVTTQIGEIEKERVKAYSSLTEQVKGLSQAQVQLQKEAGNLVSALRKPTVRGRWGEIQLRRVVEMAGMVDHCDFEEQRSVETDDGRLRPDVVIHLPGDKIIVVDAKAPLEAYLDSIEAEDDDVRATGMRRHAEQIRTHVKQLSVKAYHDQFSTSPDMVVMFLPGESFFYAALTEDPSLIEYGVERSVIIATPTTLIALLRAVAYGWRQERIAENAQNISRLGQELYERISTMVDHFSLVGKRLDSAVSSYNKAVGSMESRVLVSARKFKEYGTGTSKDVATIEPVDTSARKLNSPEGGLSLLPPVAPD